MNLHVWRNVFLLMSMIFLATRVGIDVWWLLVSILVSFWVCFGIIVSTVSVSIFTLILYPLRIHNGSKSSLRATVFDRFLSATLPSIFFHVGFFGRALGPLWLILVPFWYPLAPLRHPLGTLLVPFYNLLSRSLDSPGFLDISLRVLLSSIRARPPSCERSTDTQPIRITCTRIHPSHRYANHKA